jgi:hypothetical protein
MKFYIFLLLFFLLGIGASNKQLQKPEEKDVIAYLIREVFLYKLDSARIGFVPLATENIKSDKPETESKYWPLLQSYFPNTPKDSLKKMVDASPWIDTAIKVLPHRIFFPTAQDYTKYDYPQLYKRYGSRPIFSISNIIYVKKNTVCIVYISAYGDGAFAVEIKKDKTGKWASHEVYTDIFGGCVVLVT